jgi:hypothetical protein
MLLADLQDRYACASVCLQPPQSAIADRQVHKPDGKHTVCPDYFWRQLCSIFIFEGQKLLFDIFL